MKSTQRLKNTYNSKSKSPAITKVANESMQTEKAYSYAWINKCYNYCFSLKKNKDKEVKDKVKKDIEKSNKVCKLSQKKALKKQSKSDNKNISEKSSDTAHHSCIWKCLLCTIIPRKHEKSQKRKKVIETIEEVEDYDWWTKYYCSMQKVPLDYNTCLNYNILNAIRKLFLV